jgi:surface polysaccharide O-acyltransferase-like enzyme
MKERNYAIDFIRLVAILAVVTIHIGSAFLDRVQIFSPSFYFLYGINIAVRFGVPLFFCISGYLLASLYSDIKNPSLFYKKRLLKIVPPYLIWSLIYFFFVFPNPKGFLTLHFFSNLVTGDFSYQLYFIPAIILLYLIFPIIILYKNIFLKPLSIICLAFVEVLLFSFVYIGSDNTYILSPLKNAAYNLLPFLVGMYISINKVDIYKLVKEKIALIFIMALALWTMIFYEAYLHMKSILDWIYIKNQWKVNVLFYGIIAGGLLYYIFEEFLIKYGSLISYLSKYSFGVFFVHVAIVHFTLLYIIDPLKLYGISYYFITLISTLILSFAFSISVSNNKPAGKILGLKG